MFGSGERRRRAGKLVREMGLGFTNSVGRVWSVKRVYVCMCLG